MAKVGWEGIEVLDNQAKQETKNEQLEIDKSYARTFETEEGKKCLKHLMSRTLDQPTWVPGGDHTSGYAREGQNSVVREIKTRMERGIRKVGYDLVNGCGRCCGVGRFWPS